jgi:hypothetical protein
MDKRQIKQMQQMAMQMQNKMQQIQEELGQTNIEGTSGGGAIVVTMNGHREVQDIKISAEVVDPEDVDMLQDLILAAISDASKKAQELTEERMGPLTSGMNLPGMF